LSNILLFWPRLFKKAWQNSKIGLNVLSFVSIAAFLLALYALFRPYIQASEMYKFERMWLEASRLFPRIQSYLIADNDILWQPVASLFTSLTDKIIYYRWEHQLFIGIPAAILLIAGLFWHFHSSYRKMLFIFLAASAFLVLLTLNVKGFTLYQYLWNLPGFSSIRSTSRVILVLMWPIAMFISIEADALLRVQAKHYIFTAIILSLLGLMATESIFFNHTTFSKADAQARLQTLKEQIPTNLPKDPVLYVWEDSNNGLIYTELDGMLLSQDLGWPALNGSSGNAPDGYGLADDCNQAVVRITQYIKFARIKDSNYYSEIISRLVPVGSGKCSWPAQMP
jgi:hypothetical protein